MAKGSEIKIDWDKLYYDFYGRRQIVLNELARIVYRIMLANKDKFRVNVTREDDLYKFTVRFLKRELAKLGLKVYPPVIGSAVRTLERLGLIDIHRVTKSKSYIVKFTRF